MIPIPLENSRPASPTRSLHPAPRDPSSQAQVAAAPPPSPGRRRPLLPPGPAAPHPYDERPHRPRHAEHSQQIPRSLSAPPRLGQIPGHGTRSGFPAARGCPRSPNSPIRTSRQPMNATLYREEPLERRVHRLTVAPSRPPPPPAAPRRAEPPRPRRPRAASRRPKARRAAPRRAGLRARDHAAAPHAATLELPMLRRFAWSCALSSA
jgi:hypothetical protein